MTNSREKEQRAHQRELKEQELEEARQQRLRDDRIKAYIEFARLTYTYKTTDPAAIIEVLAAYSAIELLSESPETRVAADQLRTQITELRKVADEVEWVEEQGKTTTTDVRHSLVMDAVVEAWNDFLRIARKELQTKSL